MPSEAKTCEVCGSEQNWFFRLPLPPASKNHAKSRTRSGALVKSGSILSWERDCKLIIGTYEPPRQPLSVSVVLEYPSAKMHRWDIDGRISMLLDALGCHRDQWIDELHVSKVEGEGWAEITVRVIELAPATGKRLEA